jgi:cobalt-zinc-cadmium resistance protein CzcA
MTGVRQDVAIKIFGENIDTLAILGNRVADIIRNIDGVSAPQVERTTGLPQITIRHDRARIAGYGLNIEDINHTISTAFAGEAAGVVYENERKFDLVVRLDSAYRTSIEDVGNLFIAASGGIQIPLSQVAEISFKDGPAQISREEGKRIIVVGFNITHRDVATIVGEVEEKLTQASILPVAYYYTFGGTFENLQKATARLKIAVPGALALIFILLYFTFGSVKESLLIFTAIPMSAIGGVFALIYRDMPFSISAGVGFIALFGVAVLNGIVLISTFNQLEKDGMEDILERVLAGTKIRLRPVLMTATVASLGFIPMALSTGAGAEVQKPLATVVIGGLITATFLTLFVLPLLYMLFTRKRKLKAMASISGALVCLLFSMDLPAQDTAIKRAGIEEILQWTKNNLQYEINNQWIQKTNARINTTTAFPKTGVFAENEDLRPSDTRGILKIGVSQSMAWPGWYKAQKNMVREQLKYYQTNTSAIEAGIKREVRESYFNLWYLQDLQHLLNRLDTIHVNLLETTRLKVKSGESPGLDSIAAQARLQELVSSRQQIVHSIRIEQERLKLLSNSSQLVLPPDAPLEKLIAPSGSGDGNTTHPLLQLQQQNIQIAQSGIAVAKQENKPDFSGRFYSQLLWAANNPFSGFSVSAAFPILGLNGHRNKVKLAEAEVGFQQAQSSFTHQGIISEREQALQELDKNKKGLAYYELTGLKQAEEIIKAATLSYQSGEIGFSDLSQYLTQAIEIRRNYLETLNKYNQSVIQYNYYINQ